MATIDVPGNHRRSAGEARAEHRARQRADAQLTERRRSAVLATSRRRGRPSLLPLGAWLLIACSVALIVAQWEVYALTVTGREARYVGMAVAIVVGLAGIWQAASRVRRAWVSLVCVAAATGLILDGLLRDNERFAASFTHVAVGVLVLLGAALLLDREPTPRAVESADRGR